MASASITQNVERNPLLFLISILIGSGGLGFCSVVMVSTVPRRACGQVHHGDVFRPDEHTGDVQSRVGASESSTGLQFSQKHSQA